MSAPLLATSRFVVFSEVVPPHVPSQSIKAREKREAIDPHAIESHPEVWVCIMRDKNLGQPAPVGWIIFQGLKRAVVVGMDCEEAQLRGDPARYTLRHI